MLESLFLLSYGFAFAQPTQPGTPITCNTSNCTPPLSETCVGTSTVVTNFQGATLRSGTANSVGAIYSFFNVATVAGKQINATITIDGVSNVSMTGTNFVIDDDAAVDQANNSIASFFAPRITPSISLAGSDLRGYVQFTIRFYLNNSAAPTDGYPSDYLTLQPLAGLNYIHYDIDGSDVGTGGWFRETGVIKDVAGLGIFANAPTELVSYTYSDAGSWKGFAGSVCERSGVSRCAQVAAAANFSTAQSSVTIRMGYDYNFTTTNYNQQPTRQYGSRFGCFTFPQQITLPVNLLSFNAAYNNQHTLLSWSTENEQNFDHFEVERSSNSFDYSSVGTKATNGSNGRSDYEFNDDLSSESGNIFYYRLKIVDRDGKYAYSKVVLIKKDSRSINGITISPNPITNGTVTVRMTSSVRGAAELQVTDLSGRILIKQTQKIYEGNNAITMNVQKLQPGIYTMQMKDGDATVTAKFSIVR